MKDNPDDKVEKTEWARFIKSLFQRAEPYLALRGDMEHAKVSHKFSLVLMNKEGGDKRIVEPAVILHDVGWSCLKAEEIKAAYGVKAHGEEARRLNRIHEEAGATIAMELLEQLKYPKDLIINIASIIRTHDSGKGFRNIEEAIVKDSDKLWRYSKKGFSLEFKRQQITPNELYSHIKKFIDKWFFTSTGLELAYLELRKRKSEYGL